MIDLSGVARHLRLSVEQLRVAADLLEQGYQPGFIERYRADETGNLPPATLWLLKLEIDRQVRLQASRERAASQLPKDAELDAEGGKFLQRATTEVEIEVALRTFRSRRQLSQNQESDKQASVLLEKLIEYQGPAIDDLTAWSAEQLSIEPDAAELALQHAGRLVGMLMHSDSNLNELLRRTIQRLAQVRVELCDPTQADADEPTADVASESNDGTGEQGSHEGLDAQHVPAQQPTETNPVAVVQQGEQQDTPPRPEETRPEETRPEETRLEETRLEETRAELPTSQASAGSQPISEPAVAAPVASVTVANETVAIEPAAGELDAQAVVEDASVVSVATENSAASTNAASEAAPAELLFSSAETKKTEKKIGKPTGKKKDDKSKANKPARKPVAKMTPRQRRRRWLIAMLQPMKSLKCPLSKLSSYQHLMLGRGRRSQLVKTELAYDRQRLVALARDTFVTEQHPLATWFAKMAEEALEHSLRAKCENDAVTDLEEIAADRLLVHSVDQLRQSLLQRPVRGHCILVIDAVGPKAAAVAVVGPTGDVLAIDEIPCSASAGIVNQNVVRLGELVHQHRVSLVALTNGPARRFLVLSLRELMKQSSDSSLRWTMADRSGADAYAVSRSALKELASHNRRHRAAIWVGRSLQDPLSELLKVDVNRLRLGSYQRELPQEPLKQLVRETIADCVFLRGIDVRKANADQLQCVTGVSTTQAQQIVTWAAQPEGTHSRKSLSESVTGWAEQDRRQAIGLLRVYGSEQPLDASIIHPDDYRLAERLIENTELTLPPNAPPDWTPLAGDQPKAASDAGSVGSANVTQSADPSADEGATDLLAPQSDRSEEQKDSLPAADSVVDAEGVGVADNGVVEESVAVADGTSENSANAIQEPQVDDSQQTTTELVKTELDTTEQVETDTDAVQQSTPDPAGAGAERGPLKGWTEKSSGGAQPPTVPAEFSEDVTVASVALPDSVDVEKLARSWQVGREKLRQVASCLHAPFADPRLQHPPVPMMRDMPTLGNLQPGECVWAVVIGVADFGAFVELAPECSGLIHISRLSSHFIEDPHQAVQVGDLVLAWVVSVDEKKNRVALTALSPAQRAAAAALEAERKSEREGQRHRSSGGGGRGGSSHSGERTGAVGSSASSGSGRGSARSDARGGDGRRGAPGGGGSGGRSRGSQPGGRGDGRGDGRGRGRPTHTKTVVVTSKKPKANITAAMKEGEEPLRSFSDLMQFYESKRSDETPPSKQP
ncbi:MAG: S1 RNA-binding domain-containing protein [Pirellulaceae bacterium]